MDIVRLNEQIPFIRFVRTKLRSKLKNSKGLKSQTYLQYAFKNIASNISH